MTLPERPAPTMQLSYSLEKGSSSSFSVDFLLAVVALVATSSLGVESFISFGAVSSFLTFGNSICAGGCFDLDVEASRRSVVLSLLLTGGDKKANKHVPIKSKRIGPRRRRSLTADSLLEKGLVIIGMGDRGYSCCSYCVGGGSYGSIVLSLPLPLHSVEALREDFGGRTAGGKLSEALRWRCFHTN